MRRIVREETVHAWAEYEMALLHPDPTAQRMLHAFATMVDTRGGRIYRARLPRFEAPAELVGSLSTHRPDLRGAWAEGPAFNVEAVSAFGGLNERLLNRWSLLNQVHRDYMKNASTFHAYWLVRTQREADRLRAVLDVRGFVYTKVFVLEVE
jgi:hypothetical protein